MSDFIDPLFEEGDAGDDRGGDRDDGGDTEFLLASGIEGATGAGGAESTNVLGGGDGDTADRPQALRVGDPRRTTTKYMTKYERARILGTRALQLRCVQAPLPLLLSEGLAVLLFRTDCGIDVIMQHECTSDGRCWVRTRPSAHRDEGTQGEQGAHHCAAVFARWELRGLGRVGADSIS